MSKSCKGGCCDTVPRDTTLGAASNDATVTGSAGVGIMESRDCCISISPESDTPVPKTYCSTGTKTELLISSVEVGCCGTESEGPVVDASSREDASQVDCCDSKDVSFMAKGAGKGCCESTTNHKVVAQPHAGCEEGCGGLRDASSVDECAGRGCCGSQVAAGMIFAPTDARCDRDDGSLGLNGKGTNHKLMVQKTSQMDCCTRSEGSQDNKDGGHEASEEREAREARECCIENIISAGTDKTPCESSTSGLARCSPAFTAFQMPEPACSTKTADCDIPAWPATDVTPTSPSCCLTTQSVARKSTSCCTKTPNVAATIVMAEPGDVEEGCCSSAKKAQIPVISDPTSSGIKPTGCCSNANPGSEPMESKQESCCASGSEVPQRLPPRKPTVTNNRSGSKARKGQEALSIPHFRVQS